MLYVYPSYQHFLTTHWHQMVYAWMLIVQLSDHATPFAYEIEFHSVRQDRI